MGSPIPTPLSFWWLAVAVAVAVDTLMDGKIAEAAGLVAIERLLLLFPPVERE